MNRPHAVASLATALLLLNLACGGLPDEPVALPAMPSVGAAVSLPSIPERQFDFWTGEWSVVNKHLQSDGSWLDGGNSVALIQPVAEGNAILERWTGEARGDRLIGFSLRGWNSDIGKWDVYLNWHGGEPNGFFLMHGERNGERMELFPPGDKTSGRYAFSLAHEGSAQWDSAVSKDGGVTWITEWVMQFTRTAPSRAADGTNASIESPPRSAFEFEQTRSLDGLLGIWEGKARRRLEDGSWQEGTAEARVTSMIEGFGLLQFLDTSWGEKTLSALGYDTRQQAWVAVKADNGVLGLLRFTGEPEDGSVTFESEEVCESWERESDDLYRFVREAATDTGWEPVLEISFARVGQ